MIELAYTDNSAGAQDQVYTIIQYNDEHEFEFMLNGALACKAEKQNGQWLQTDGEAIDSDLLQKMGSFVEQHRR